MVPKAAGYNGSYVLNIFSLAGWYVNCKLVPVEIEPL
jgi:hypothetical protein